MSDELKANLVKKVEGLLDRIQINNKRGLDAGWRYIEEREEAAKCAELLKEILTKAQKEFEGRAAYFVNTHIERIDDISRKLNIGVYEGFSFLDYSITLEGTCEDFYQMLKRPPYKSAKASGSPKPSGETYIAEARIKELKDISSDKWDYLKLVELCRELNVAYSNSCVHATGMLVRSLLDHVPPVFGVANFDGVISNYGGKSFKGQMRNLNSLSREISNGYLHGHIRRHESMPNMQQVDFRSLIDALLGEIVRIEKAR